MTHEQAFLADILARPDDDAPRLLYADWLDERGDPRASRFNAHQSPEGRTGRPLR